MEDVSKEFDNELLIMLIDGLFSETQSFKIKITLAYLAKSNDFDELQESLVVEATREDADNSTMADGLYNKVITYAFNYLAEVGVKLSILDINAMLPILKTLNELSTLTKDNAIEMMPLISDDENDTVYIFCSIVSYFTDTRELDMYDAIEYIKPTLYEQLVRSIETVAEDVYEEVDTVDQVYTTSYLYNTYINNPDIKLPYESLLDKLAAFTKITTNATLLSKEIYILVTFSKDIENDIYFLQTTVTEDLAELFMGRDIGTEDNIKNLINGAIALLKG